MQPWRPRPHVFEAYEQAWREEHNLDVVKHEKTTKIVKVRRQVATTAVVLSLRSLSQKCKPQHNSASTTTRLTFKVQRRNQFKIASMKKFDWSAQER